MLTFKHSIQGKGDRKNGRPNDIRHTLFYAENSLELQCHITLYPYVVCNVLASLRFLGLFNVLHIFEAPINLGVNSSCNVPLS